MNVYAEVTERIIKQMEQGQIPWQQPWVGKYSIVSHATGKPYSILNQFLLGKPGEYATFKQIKDEGGHVKKGAKAKFVVFWKILERKNEQDEIETIPFLKHSCVFSLDDCEGVKAKYIEEGKKFDNKPIEAAQNVFESYIKRENIKLEYGEGGAFYRPSADLINLPAFDTFISAEAFYDTAFHEAAHSTGASNRLNRKGIVEHHGRTEYSKEELIAEISACSLMHMLGIETKETFRNNAAYIQNWLEALQNDIHMLVNASSAASKAVDFIIGGDNNA